MSGSSDMASDIVPPRSAWRHRVEPASSGLLRTTNPVDNRTAGVDNARASYRTGSVPPVSATTTTQVPPRARPSVTDLLAAAVGAVPAGVARPGQQAMADAVAHAARSGEHLLVQAGTGTGKSLAYLVPALLVDGPVVVS